jgi:hypothetical protein
MATMSGLHTLSKQTIIAALAALNEKLRTRETTGEICIFGGAAMILAFDARESTRDVDALFVPKAAIANAIEEVAEELGLSGNWLNDGVKGFVSEVRDITPDDMPQFSHLRVLRPTAPYLLAMKCLAARIPGYDTAGDSEDVKTLIRNLGLRSPEEVFDIIGRYYQPKDIPAKTRYFVEEVAEELWVQTS